MLGTTLATAAAGVEPTAYVCISDKVTGYTFRGGKWVVGNFSRAGGKYLIKRRVHERDNTDKWFFSDFDIPRMEWACNAVKTGWDEVYSDDVMYYSVPMISRLCELWSPTLRDSWMETTTTTTRLV